MPKKQTIVGFDEIFNYAEEIKGWHWNQCCEIFHGRNEILCSPENNNKNFYLEDLRAEVEYMKENTTSKYYSKEKEEAYEVILSFMEKHKLKEIMVTND